MSNGPDRSLGTWRYCGARFKFKVERGLIYYSFGTGYAWLSDSDDTSVNALLMQGAEPVDNVAKREAIRAGWREVEGRWAPDDRVPLGCLCPYSGEQPTPACYEVSAKYREEWPEEEEETAPYVPARKMCAWWHSVEVATANFDGGIIQYGFNAHFTWLPDPDAEAPNPNRIRASNLSDAELSEEERPIAAMLLALAAHAKEAGIDFGALVRRVVTSEEGI